MGGADETEWRILCDQERERREALAFHPKPFSQGFREALKSWWASVQSLLDSHVRASAAGLTAKPVPVELLNALKGFAGYLAVGQIPGPIADVVAEGRRVPGPMERRDIGLAVAYLVAAKTGIEHRGERISVKDHAPVKTICKEFGVARTTVQGWQRETSPSFLGVNPVNEEVLADLMKSAGERYRTAGRSTKAILRRGRRN